MVIRKIHVKVAAVFLLYFAFSLFFSGYYVTGDQFFYRSYYDDVRELGLVDGYVLYNLTLAASEPVYYFVTWLGSRLLDKDVLMSLLNAILVTCGFIYLKRTGTSSVVICVLALNFYLLVLMFAAERLKLAALFCLIALLLSSKRVLFLLLAALSQFQALIIVVALACRRLGEMLRLGFKIQRRHVLRIVASALLIMTAGAALTLVFLPALLTKAEGHLQEGLTGILKPALFMVLSMFYAKHRRVEAFAVNLPIVAFSYFLGSDRLTIASYFAFLYFGLKVNRGRNIGVLASSSYFAVKGVLFLMEVYQQGQAFVDEDEEF